MWDWGGRGGGGGGGGLGLQNFGRYTNDIILINVVFSH